VYDILNKGPGSSKRVGFCDSLQAWKFGVWNSVGLRNFFFTPVRTDRKAQPTYNRIGNDGSFSGVNRLWIYIYITDFKKEYRHVLISLPCNVIFYTIILLVHNCKHWCSRTVLNLHTRNLSSRSFSVIWRIFVSVHLKIRYCTVPANSNTQDLLQDFWNLKPVFNNSFEVQCNISFRYFDDS